MASTDTFVKPLNFEGFKRAVLGAITVGVRTAAEKAMESAVEDAPVRAVFFKGSSRRRRGLRRRALTMAEASSEDFIRRKMAARSGHPYRPATTAHFTGGRRFTGMIGIAKQPEPYLRLASTRKGNPNSFAPFLIRPGLTAADIKEFKAFRAERKALGGHPQVVEKLALEREPAVRGGRELTPGGRLRLQAAKDALDARGRNELRTGRANFIKKKGVKGRKYGDASRTPTLGGTLRRSIFMSGPHMIGSVIKARVVSPVYYSQYQEFGTRHNRATPYMRPAIAKLHGTFRREMVKAINSIHWR